MSKKIEDEKNNSEKDLSGISNEKAPIVPKRTREERKAFNKQQKKMRKQKSQEEAPSFDLISDTDIESAEYYFKDGLRFVKPYYFTFQVWAKRRWLKRPLIEVLCQEFHAHPSEYYKQAVEDGRILVNGQNVNIDWEITDSSHITHKIHRHEPPVTDKPIKIVHQDEQLVVIDKPSSIPVHPCGRYHHNSVLFILASENSLKGLYPVHRIDRLTSGICMMSRNPIFAEQLSIKIRDRLVEKKYLALVKNYFPHESIEVKEPIVVVAPREGVCRCSRDDPRAKESLTIFRRISYSSEKNQTLIECVPKTGRTHQIRVHLSWLGFPIINDPLYGPHPIRAQIDTTTTTSSTTTTTNNLPSTNVLIDPTQTSCSSEGIDLKVYNKFLEPAKVGETAPWCPHCTVNYLDPDEEAITMYLHSHSYKSSEWEYKTSIPLWAQGFMTSQDYKQYS